MKLVRSEVRHALYRKKNNQPSVDMQAVYDQVEPGIPQGESWQTFALNWDVFVKNGKITVIKPEIDYDFIHATCLEKSIRTSVDRDHPEDGEWASPRQANVIQIVELNMLDQMTWLNYNRTWGVSVDKDLRKITTRLFLTVVNKVTEAMIEATKQSDGTAFTEPSLPKVIVTLKESLPMTDSEIAMFIEQHAPA